MKTYRRKMSMLVLNSENFFGNPHGNPKKYTVRFSMKYWINYSFTLRKFSTKNTLLGIQLRLQQDFRLMLVRLTYHWFSRQNQPRASTWNLVLFKTLLYKLHWIYRKLTLCQKEPKCLTPTRERFWFGGTR